jgi:hypothetical protein
MSLLSFYIRVLRFKLKSIKVCKYGYDLTKNHYGTPNGDFLAEFKIVRKKSRKNFYSTVATV